MKKSLLSILSIGITAFCLGAQDVEEPVKFKTADGIYFQVNDDDPTTVSVLPIDDGYQDAELVIPAQVTDAESGITYTVTAAASEAFYATKSTTIKLPATMTRISGDAFYNNRTVNIVVDEANPAYVSVDGLLYTKDMTTLCCFPSKHDAGGYTLPESVVKIGDYAFNGVWLTALEIPARINYIGRGAFMGTQLRNVVIPATVTNIGGAAFQFCQSLTSIEFPEGMTVMPDHILATSWMLEKVNLPSTLVEIGMYAFNQTFTYGVIKEIVIPDEVVKIEAGAFQACRGLTSLTLGKSLASINLYAFAQCSGLKSVTSLNPVPPVCIAFDGNSDEVVNTFAEVPDDCVLYVPSESVDAYTATWGYKFKDIRPIDTGGVENVSAGAGNGFAVSTSNGVLSVSADAAVDVFNASGVRVASAADGRIFQSFPSGVYVVRSASRIVKVAL